jgi:PTH1 family peptidyl-tRNA hydrolase
VKIVLGLGNPGPRYRFTRHNLGVRVVDLVAERCRARLVPLREGPAAAAAIRIGTETAILARPRTYMNRSGRAAAALVERYGVDPGGLVVVYDDADLELGKIRIRHEGGAGGHNGVRSIIGVLRTEAFPRVRLGIFGRERESTELMDYVLGEFEPQEVPVARALVELGADAVEESVRHGIAEAMNRFNGRSARAE